ncbi:MAG: glycosyltransferase family 4 protein [Verrucomicrobia bacterium]|nr:glycosyltransferase family 4 protein [Verrucomicrobiota bacterium]
MNILIFSSNSHYLQDSVGGAETSLRRIAEGLVVNGQRVTYLTNGHRWWPGVETRVIDGVQVVLLSPIYIRGVSWIRWLRQLNIGWIRAQQRRQLARLAATHAIDIVHTYNTSHNTYDALLVRERHGLKYKVVQRIAGLFWFDEIQQDPTLAPRVAWVFNNVDYVNFISDGLRTLFFDHLAQLGLAVTPRQEGVMDIGIDLSRFPARRHHPDAASLNIACVARMTARQKRQDLLIEALRLLKGKSIHIHFYGDGDRRRHYERLAARYGIAEQVTFHGFLPQDELKRELMSASVFAMPTNFEGLGKSVLEAMAIKIPVLVSDVLPLNQYIRNGETGLIIANTPEAWAAAIQQLLDNALDLRQLADRARAYIEEHYDSARNIERYCSTFEKLCAGGPS